MRGKTIVIDREYGSGGREVAKLLSEKLGIPFYDGELLVLASEKYGIDLGMMKDPVQYCHGDQLCQRF